MSAADDMVEDCCSRPENLTRSKLGPTLWVDTCEVCGRKHYVMEADSLTVGTVPGDIGKH
jgi:hypothetical protein